MINLESFLDVGVHHFNKRVDQEKSKELLQKVHKIKNLGPNIFLDEAVFKSNPQFKGVNPMPGCNLAEELSQHISYIDNDVNVIENLTAVLGSNYKIINKKFVCGVPQAWMPSWVKEYIAETGVKNLGPYIKPEYRDMTYFSGIDFHQDIIDWPEVGPSFITMYVYLDDVNINDAPLHILPKSHVFGATKFPHNLRVIDNKTWEYSSDSGESAIFEHKLLTGKSGDVSLWHPFILHGTQPDTNTKPRISLRYLIKVSGSENQVECGISKLNKKIIGDMKLSTTRNDLNENGEAIVKGNHVNQIKY